MTTLNKVDESLATGFKPTSAIDEKVRYKVASVGGVKIRRRVGGRPNPQASRRAKQNFRRNRARMLMALRKGQKRNKARLHRLRSALAREDINSRQFVDTILSYVEQGGTTENAINLIQHGQVVVEDRETFADALVCKLDDVGLGENLDDIRFNGSVAIIEFLKPVPDEARKAFESSLDGQAVQWTTPQKAKVALTGVSFDEATGQITEFGMDDVDDDGILPDSPDADQDDDELNNDDPSKTGTHGPVSATTEY